MTNSVHVAPATQAPPLTPPKTPSGGMLEEAKLLLVALAERPNEPALDNPQDLLRRAKALKRPGTFRYARQLLAYAFRSPNLDPDLRRRIGQQYALCTYKDTDLPIEARLDRAADILERTDRPETSVDPETLGIAGAIQKRRWEFSQDTRSLELSLHWYRRGHQISMTRPLHADSGYPGINAAIVLDLLAVQSASRVPTALPPDPELAEQRRMEAVAIRRDLLSRLANARIPNSDESWWYLVTMGEAALGSGDAEGGRAWLRRARAARALTSVEDGWEYESTARQVATMVRNRLTATDRIEDSPEWKVVAEFLGTDDAALRSAFGGKVGLALSGGGFRASFYHIGVLARLAELDVLRHVEVLSCVSGGSIIGAHYYLLLRQLMQGKADGEITRDDYVMLVSRLSKDFLEGVQTNIRMHALAEMGTSLQLIFRPHYTRTRRLGELYEKKLYSRVDDDGRGGRRWLNDLFIQPRGARPEFRPRNENWRRRNKVPELVLNATTLNTGHNWQFTASWMGEPPAGIDRQVDGNERLRRMYYREAPRNYQKMRLGHAVAASACVPGLFEPLALPDLYIEDDVEHERRTVSLVDGGVHDNQGVASLLEQDCTVLLVSDASGQMAALARSRGDNLGALARSFSISQQRVRVAEYDELDARRRASLLRGLMFIHLKKDLDVLTVPWIGCTEPGDADAPDVTHSEDRITSYGVRKDMQRHLAAIRTDLDSFSDVEAYSLMLDGYRMAEHELEQCIPADVIARSSSAPVAWPFLSMAPALTTAGDEDTPVQKEVARLLSVAKNVAFKVWRLPSARLVATTAVVVVAAIVLWMAASRAWQLVSHDPLSVTILRWGGAAALVLALASVISAVVRLFGYKESPSQVATGIGLGLLGVVLWPLNRLHLHIFDPIFKSRGRLSRVLPKGIGPNSPSLRDSAAGATLPRARAASAPRIGA